MLFVSWVMLLTSVRASVDVILLCVMLRGIKRAILTCIQSARSGLVRTLTQKLEVSLADSQKVEWLVTSRRHVQ